MTTLILKLVLNNAAFREEDGGALNMEEVAYKVTGIANRIALGEFAGAVTDANGNTVGSFSIEGEPRSIWAPLPARAVKTWQRDASGGLIEEGGR